MPDHTQEAMNAQTNLTVFHSVISILEGGNVYGGENLAASKIITICKKEMQRQLHIMDAAKAKATKGKP